MNVLDFLAQPFMFIVYLACLGFVVFFVFKKIKKIKHKPKQEKQKQEKQKPLKAKKQKQEKQKVLKSREQKEASATNLLEDDERNGMESYYNEEQLSEKDLDGKDNDEFFNFEGLSANSFPVGEYEHFKIPEYDYNKVYENEIEEIAFDAAFDVNYEPAKRQNKIKKVVNNLTKEQQIFMASEALKPKD